MNLRSNVEKLIAVTRVCESPFIYYTVLKLKMSIKLTLKQILEKETY